MNTSLRKKLIIPTGLCVVLIIGGCKPLNLRINKAESVPVPAPVSVPEPKQKVYQSVNSVKLSNASFAVDYYGKDIETDMDFYKMLPQAARWTPPGYNTTAWVNVYAVARKTAGPLIGLVIPKKSGCTNDLLEAGFQTTTVIHMWGTVHNSKHPGIASVIIVDKCEAKKKSYGRSVM